MNRPKETRNAIFILIASMLLAVLTLLIFQELHPSWQSDQFDALLLSLVFSISACILLFARRCGQAHMALGIYLLAIGGAAVVLPRLVLVDYGQVDPDALFLLVGPLYLLAGSILVLVSLLNHRYWMKRKRTLWIRIALLAGPGAMLLMLYPIAFGPRLWDHPPHGFDLVAASLVLGAGIFFAGSAVAARNQPGVPPQAHTSSRQ